MPCSTPLQIQFCLSNGTSEQFDLTSPEPCGRLISFFVEAAEYAYEFSQGKALHRLYEKTMAFSCADASMETSIALSHLCKAARETGYLTKVVAESSFFTSYIGQHSLDVRNISEAWLLKSSGINFQLEHSWRMLCDQCVPVIVVARPELTLDCSFLDSPEISASTFRIISPNAYSKMWPFEFCIDEAGCLSQPVSHPRWETPITSIATIFRQKDAQQIAPADARKRAAEL